MPNVLKDELRRGSYRRDQDRSRGARSTPYDVYGEPGQVERDRWEWSQRNRSTPYEVYGEPGQYDRGAWNRSQTIRSTPYEVYGEPGQFDRGRWDRDYDYDRGDRGYPRQYDRSQIDRGQFDQYRYQESPSDTGYESNKDDTTYYEYVEEWYIPGPFSGVGPKSYHRSDENILEDVCERLMQHGLIDARNMRVEVQNGEVTLDGTVNSRREKRMAEDTADSVTGVTDVHNRLRVSTGETESTGKM